MTAAFEWHPDDFDGDGAIDFGHGWYDRYGRRGSVRWFPDSGALVYFAAGGDIERLAVIPEEVDVRARMTGWAEACFEYGIDWVRTRMSPEACPACGGSGILGHNFNDEPVPVGCWCRAGAPAW